MVIGWEKNFVFILDFLVKEFEINIFSFVPLFSRNPEDHEIYIMNADGSDQTNISKHSGFDGSPVFSPNGKKIAFVSDRSGRHNVWIMNADGSDLYNLTNSSSENYYPSWNPDGTKITYDSYSEGAAGGDIFIINVDGSNPKNLTNTKQDEGYPS